MFVICFISQWIKRVYKILLNTFSKTFLLIIKDNSAWNVSGKSLNMPTPLIPLLWVHCKVKKKRNLLKGMDAIMQLTQHSSRNYWFISRTVTAKKKCSKQCDKRAESLFCWLQLKPSIFERSRFCRLCQQRTLEFFWSWRLYLVLKKKNITFFASSRHS